MDAVIATILAHGGTANEAQPGAYNLSTDPVELAKTHQDI